MHSLTYYIHSEVCMHYIINTGSSGSVQLRGGVVPEAGTVEYCISGTWRAVCHNNWDYKDAFVVCRQLGFPATGEHSCNVNRHNIAAPRLIATIHL